MIHVPLTQDDTLGPYFPPPFSEGQGALDLYRPHLGLDVGPKGVPVVLRIRLLDVDGQLAHGTLLEVWAPSSSGALRVPGSDAALSDDPFFVGYGRIYSVDGAFEVRLAMPGAMSTSRGTRAPFVTLTIFSDGIARVVTQVFFEGRDENETDLVLSALPSHLRPRLIARRRGDSAQGQVYALDIKLRGEDETPFFDDDVSKG